MLGRRWLTADLLVTLGFLALSVWAIQQARLWPFRAALFPVLTASIVLGLVLLKLVLDVASAPWHSPVTPSTARGDRPMGEQTTEEAEFEDAFKTAPRSVWLAALGWMGVFFAMLWALGIFFAVPLFTLLYLRLVSRESPLLAGAFAAIAWAFVYGLFDRVLHIPLPSSAFLGVLGV